MVVRKPEWNFDAQGRGAFPATVPCVSGTYYGGIDRMAWFDVDEALYSNTLPEPLRVLRGAARTHDLTGIDLLPAVEDALRLLEFSNRLALHNTLVSVYSERLAEYKGSFTTAAISLNRLGFDVVQFGGSSLLFEGLFFTPSEFAEFCRELTPSGLLRDESSLPGFVNRYLECAARQIVEPLHEGPFEIDALEVSEVVYVYRP